MVPEHRIAAGMRWSSLVTGLLIAAGSTSSVPADVATPSLASDVAPIMTQRCVMCHIAGAVQAGLDLYTNPWGAIVNVKSTQSPLNLVEAGEPEKSYFYLKLTGAHLAAGGSGEQMPFQAGQLDATQMELIRAWIAQGAQNN
jgi:mono/diheme cytochrome c family protein